MNNDTSSNSTPDDEVAPLVRVLREGRTAERHAAVQALPALGAQAEATIPAVIDLLQHADLSLRTAAAAALARLGRPAVPALVAALHAPDADLRKAAVIVLGRVGTDARDALPALEELVADDWLGRWAERATHAIRHGPRRGWRGRLAGWAWTGTLLLVSAVAAFSVATWLRESLGRVPGTVLAGSVLAVAGVLAGWLLGVLDPRQRSAVLPTLLLGLGTGLAGLAFGWVVATLLEPPARAFGR